MGHVYKKGDGWAISFIDKDGARVRRKIGPDKKDAEKALLSYMGKVAREEHLGIIEDSDISFADFGQQWLEKITPTLKPMARRRWEGILRVHLEPFFRGALRATVTSNRAEEFKMERIKAG